MVDHATAKKIWKEDTMDGHKEAYSKFQKTDAFSSTGAVTDLTKEINNEDILRSVCDDAVLLCTAHASKTEVINLVDSGPESYQEYSRLDEAERQLWEVARATEDNNLINRNVYVEMPLQNVPKGIRLIQTRYVFVKKIDEKGNRKFKARLCAKDFRKKYLENEEDEKQRMENYAPVVRTKNVRLIICIATIHGMHIFQFDVDAAFLNAEYSRIDVYVRPPPGYYPSGIAWRLLRPLYGMQDAPKEWYECLVKFLFENGFQFAKNLDECLFFRRSRNGGLILMGIHVDDDLAAVSKDEETISFWNGFKQRIHAKFGIKDLGTPTWCLGVNMFVTPDAIHMTQESYIKKSLERFKLADLPTAAMPELVSNNEIRIRAARLASPESAAQKLAEEEIMEMRGYTQELYRQQIGTLLYAAIQTRPDIAHAVQLLSRDIVNPTLAHFEAVNYVFRYLNRTANYGLKYDYENNKLFSTPLQITAFSDSDYAGDLKTSKSTTGFIILLNDRIVHWISKQQPYVTHSTCAAEYVAMSQCTQEIIWIVEVLTSIGFKVETPIIHGDNEATVKLIKKKDHHEKLRSVRVAQHLVKDEYQEGRLDAQWIPGKSNVADIFTKALTKPLFELCRDCLVAPSPH
jgi:hypothetical protein